MITLHIDKASAEYALTAMLLVAAMLDAEHQSLKVKGVWGLERGQAKRRHEDMDRHMRALTASMQIACQRGAEQPSRKDLVRALSDVAALVDVARRTLSVEDYGDALTGASTRLTALIKQLAPEDHG